MRLLTLISLNAVVLSFAFAASAGEGAATCTYARPAIKCAVSASEKFCFAKVSCDDGVEGTAVCAPVNGKCPSEEACMADPTDADAQMEKLGTYKGLNVAGCAAFATAPPPKPPVGGGMGGAAGPGR